MPIPLGILAQAGRSIGGASDYELIESVILTSSQASVTFSNLGNYSSTYQHLQIRAVTRSNRSSTYDNLFIRFNGDTANNYARHLLWGNGSFVESYSTTNANRANIGFVSGGNSGSNIFASQVIDILDPFETTKNKTIRSLAGMRNGSDNYVSLFSGAWFSTNSLTSITLIDEDSSFVSGSRFSLYGVK